MVELVKKKAQLELDNKYYHVIRVDGRRGGVRSSRNKDAAGTLLLLRAVPPVGLWENSSTQWVPQGQGLLRKALACFTTRRGEFENSEVS